jgi:Ca2+-binding RTX toxin-like protein
MRAAKEVMIESMERRVLLSSASVVDGVLLVRGTRGADHISFVIGKDAKHVHWVIVNFGADGVQRFQKSLFKIIRVEGGRGDDVIEIRPTAQPMWIAGGPGNDALSGGNGADTIFGGDGNDTLLGLSGADLMHGDRGDDLVRGFDGNDTLFGDGGNDEVRGGENDDWISGGPGRDLLRDQAGKDTVYGNAGSDTFWFYDSDNQWQDRREDEVFKMEELELPPPVCACIELLKPRL